LTSAALRSVSQKVQLRHCKLALALLQVYGQPIFREDLEDSPQVLHALVHVFAGNSLVI
jgi:hypothetical protein